MCIPMSWPVVIPCLVNWRYPQLPQIIREHLWMDQFTHSLQAKDAALSSLLLIIDLNKDRICQTQDKRLIRKHAQNIRAALDLLVKTFQRIGQIDAGSLLLRKCHICQNVVFSPLQNLGCFRPAVSHCPDHFRQLLPSNIPGWFGFLQDQRCFSIALQKSSFLHN